MDDASFSAPILDRAHLARQTADDRALEAELLALFEAQCRRLAPVIRHAGEAERREAAHSLRGAALAVGAGRIAALAAAIEDRSGATGTSGGPGLADRLEDAMTEVFAAIADRKDAAM